VLQYHFNWKVLSAIAGITWWNFYFRLCQRTIRAPQVVDFLAHLLRHLRGRLLVIWDRSKDSSQPPGRGVCRRPAGPPGVGLPASLRPGTQSGGVHFGGYWKHHELPNFCPHDFSQLSYHARHTLRRMRRPMLVMAFWEQADLFPL
jgi:hypothetical protein